jgi:hypothetical protein
MLIEYRDDWSTIIMNGVTELSELCVLQMNRVAS